MPVGRSVINRLPFMRRFITFNQLKWLKLYTKGEEEVIHTLVYIQKTNRDVIAPLMGVNLERFHSNKEINCSRVCKFLVFRLRLKRCVFHPRR